MNWKLLNYPLGTPCAIGNPQKKEVVPLAVPIAMAAGSAASSIFGGISSSKAAKEAQRQQEQEKNRLEAERLRKLNQDYVDTAAGQNMLRIARDQADKVWKREAGAKAVAGGTDAAAAMAKEQGNKLVGDAVANIAANDTLRKDQIDASYRQDLARVNQNIQQTKMQQANATAQAAGAASNALAQGAMATFGGTKLGQSWFGTGNGTGVGGQLVKSNEEWLKTIPNPWTGGYMA